MMLIYDYQHFYIKLSIDPHLLSITYILLDDFIENRHMMHNKLSGYYKKKHININYICYCSNKTAFNLLLTIYFLN